jgi:glyoxylase-like metal-dependent hydrolase (beta-lactamase superfamily II)
MKVHHLSCGSLCPPFFSSAVKGKNSEATKMICHCLLIETNSGLVLVDTGFGMGDVRTPKENLGGGFLWMTGGAPTEEVTALHQLKALGYAKSDLKHIVPTHLDLDHAGGISDFPDATVHIYRKEYDAAMARATMREENRYRPCHWAHNPKWEIYDDDGESWKGLTRVRPLEGIPPEIFLVPTIGHTRGHVAVAIERDNELLIHAGDAYFSKDEMEDPPSCPFGLAGFQRAVAIDNAARLRNQKELRRLHLEEKAITFCAHDEDELLRMQRRAC